MQCYFHRAGLAPASATAALLLAAIIAGCGDDHRCKLNDTNGIWSQSGFDASVSDPATCPIEVGQPSFWTDFGAAVVGPAAKVAYDELANTDITNNNSSPVVTVYGYFTPQCDGCAYSEADIQGRYPVASASDAPVQSGSDHATITFDVSDAGIAAGRVDLAYRVGTYTDLMNPPTNLQPGVSYTWHGHAENGTAPYQFQWLQDGSALVGKTDTLFSTYYTQGSFRLALAATDANGHSDTASIQVTVNLATGIDGPSGVRPNYACTWFASPSGGVPPFAYEWYVDGYSAGTSSSWSDYLAPGGHSIELDVSDSAGQYASSTMGITVDDTQPSCDI